MLHWLVGFSLRNRVLTCALAVVLIVVGGRSLLVLPIDAFPDTTPVQVQINCTAASLNPPEVEAQITIPIELAINGLPGLQNVRSISKFGLSQVVATFGDGTEILKARQSVSERLQPVELPDGIARPQLGPIATGLGEVFHYVLRSTSTNRTLTELRELQDWVVKPQLRQVPGVAEVNSWGGYEKQYHVIVQTDLLVKYGLTFDDLVGALQANNRNVGGGQIVRGGDSLLVHGIGLTTNVAEIAAIVIQSRDGTPVRVQDVATVNVDHEIRRGAVTSDGRGEVVLGLGFMLMGENSAQVTRALKARLAEVRKSLPPDVVLETLYDRTELVDRVIRTVEHNLMAGALLVIAVLFAFLGNLRAGLIVALSIPLSMMFAGSLMLQTGIAASLLSLGAVDFGLIVDGAVVMMENIVRRLAERQHELGRPLTPGEREETLAAAPLEVVRPAAFGVGIILAVFLPLLALEGIEGKLFKPMALTLIFALSGSLVLALTLTPVLAALMLPKTIRETVPWPLRVARRVYEPALGAALRFKKSTVLFGAILFALAMILATRIGGEFLPKLGEGAIVGTTVRLSGISVDESVRQNQAIERALLAEFPDEIDRIWTRLGTAEVATDPMGVELADFFLALKPASGWKKARTQTELTAELRSFLAQVPGMRTSFSQPIEMRLNEMIAGARGDIALKIFGDDLATLKRLGGEAQEILASIRGASEVSVEQLTGQGLLEVHVNAQATARYGVSARNVLDVVQAVGSFRVSDIREGQRSFPLVVRLPDNVRTDPKALGATLIPVAGGSVLPLRELATIQETEGPSSINREWGRRRITVQCNVHGRDVKSFVNEARTRMAKELQPPEGYTVQWGGQFENMERANQRLGVAVPMALGIIMVLLFLALGRVQSVLVVASGIPLGWVGGITALWLRGLPFTVSAGVGFIALCGVAILNGLMLVTFIEQRIREGIDPASAVREGCLVRLRPVLMTALVAALGFLPMAVNVGIGGEVQQPLATVVIGGIITNTLLTLLVLPALYSLARRRPD